MASFPKDLRYTEEHEWARLEEDDEIVTIGITDYAQRKLGGIVYVELPSEGDEVRKGDSFGQVESTKSVSDLFSPVTGKVHEVNEVLKENPEIVNEDPYEDGWMIKIRVDGTEELDDLMSNSEYEEHVGEEDDDE